MIRYILALFVSRHKMAKHLMRKQGEIRELQNYVRMVEKERDDLKSVIHDFHEAFKKCRNYAYWF